EAVAAGAGRGTWSARPPGRDGARQVTARQIEAAAPNLESEPGFSGSRNAPPGREADTCGYNTPPFSRSCRDRPQEPLLRRLQDRHQPRPEGGGDAGHDAAPAQVDLGEISHR